MAWAVIKRGASKEGGIHVLKWAELTPVCEASETPFLMTLGAGVAETECFSGYSAALSQRVFRCFGSG